MIFVEVFMAFAVAVDAVVSTADAWAPVLFGVLALGAGLRWAPRLRHRRGGRPDVPGQGPDTGADTSGRDDGAGL